MNMDCIPWQPYLCHKYLFCEYSVNIFYQEKVDFAILKMYVFKPLYDQNISDFHH